MELSYIRWNGHPAPFNIKYIEIGNENNQGPTDTSRSDHYKARYMDFYNAIKGKYPNVECIGNVEAWGTDTPSWAGTEPVDYIDEHYYRGTKWLEQMATKYDTYDRNGPKVYAGEYAVTTTSDCGKGNLNAAVGEAAFLTGVERNSDVVKMTSYAPLFVNTNDRAWSPDAIVYDSSRAYGTSSYYVQKMFSQNLGSTILKTTLTDLTQTTPTTPIAIEITGGIAIGSWNTQDKYDNVKVTNNTDGNTLFSDDFSGDASKWTPVTGTWNIGGGAYNQTNGTATPAMASAGNTNWKNYTVELDGTKTAGSEGFMIYFGFQDSDTFYDLNLGGWNNTKNTIQRQKATVSTVIKQIAGSINTNQTYKIKIVVNGINIKCYLDGTQILMYLFNLYIIQLVRIIYQ